MPDLQEELSQLAKRIPSLIEHSQTEEATKTAFILPFLNALGYNVFDPKEIVPEFTADVGIRRGEKIDYAVMRDGIPIILIECKWCGADLDNEHASQLFRYYATLPTRIAVLTNGIIYRFFADLDEPNKMDSKPFFEFSMSNLSEPVIRELRRFQKQAFDVEEIIPAAEELKYTREIKRIMADLMAEPSKEFVRLFAAQIYPGNLTAAVRDRFTELVKRAVQAFISERVADRLRQALADEETPNRIPATTQETPASSEPTETASAGSKVQTTEDEMQAYYIVKAIARSICSTSRIALRDGVAFCSVLFDDNNRKPICRFYFNRSKKAVGIFDASKNETRHDVESLDDLFVHAEALKAVTMGYAVTETKA